MTPTKHEPPARNDGVPEHPGIGYQAVELADGQLVIYPEDYETSATDEWLLGTLFTSLNRMQ